MKDKAHNGQVDSSRDHHMINGTLVPVVERSPNRSQKARASKRNRGAKGGKGVEASPSAKD